MAKPWERQPNETAAAFAAFESYRALGPKRGLRGLAAALPEQSRRHLRTLEQWSKRYGWVERIKAIDDDNARIEREAIEAQAEIQAVAWAKAREPIRREAWRISEELLEMAREFLQRWKRSTRPPAFDSVVRAFELALRCKQFAAGMPSESKEINTVVQGTLDVRWEEELRRAYGQKPAQVVDVEATALPAPAPAPAQEAAP